VNMTTAAQNNSHNSEHRKVKQEEAVLQQWTAIASSPDRRASTAQALAKAQPRVQSGRALSGFAHADGSSRRPGSRNAGPEESSDGEEDSLAAEEERRRIEEEERESRALRRSSIRPRLVRQLIDQIDGSDSDD